MGLEAVPSLYKLLKDSDSRVRYSAIEALLEINTNENINDPKFYKPIIQLKYDSDDSIRASAELADVLRDNLILINNDRYEDNRLDNTYSSNDDINFHLYLFIWRNWEYYFI